MIELWIVASYSTAPESH